MEENWTSYPRLVIIILDNLVELVLSAHKLIDPLKYGRLFS